MIAYKFLRAGRVAPFTGFRWEPETWVDAGSAVICGEGVHACRAGDLPYWLRSELWEIELAGEIVEAERKLVAERGRLVRRVEAWNADAYAELARACAERIEALAEEHPGNDRLKQIAADTDLLLSLGYSSLVPFFASVAAGHAGGADARPAERAKQAAWLAEHVL